MKLTDEQIYALKEKNETSLDERPLSRQEGRNLIRTIEALQQEKKELNSQCDTLADTVNMFSPYVIGKPEAEVIEDLKQLLTLRKENEHLHSMVAKMRYMLNKAQCYLPDDTLDGKIDDALSDTPTDYHNPADIEALKWLERCLTYTEEHQANAKYRQAGEGITAAKDKCGQALAAIEQIGGGGEK